MPALGFALVLAPETGAQAAEVTETFTTVGAAEWTVPEDAACVTFVVTGAGGGAGAEFGGGDAAPEGGGQLSLGGAPGLGGQVTATIVVTPGETLSINVGGQGTDGDAGSDGGFNGGGAGGDENKGSDGGGGGGASDVRRGGTDLSDRILVGGGGGGGGAGGPADTEPETPDIEAPADEPVADDGAPVDAAAPVDPYETEGIPVGEAPGGDGGAGGGLSGGGGDDGFLTGVTAGTGGGGGTQTAGGTAGDENPKPVPGTSATAGTAGDGGEGGSSGDGGGGGGGGWFGGGGGGSGFGGTGSGGGGGSGHGPADATYADGVEDGDGSVVVSYTPGDESCGGVLPDVEVPDVISGRPTFTG